MLVNLPVLVPKYLETLSDGNASLMFIRLPDLFPQVSQHPLWQQRFSWMLVRLPGLVYKYLEHSLAESFSLMCITLPAPVPRYLETLSGGNASL